MRESAKNQERDITPQERNPYGHFKPCASTICATRLSRSWANRDPLQILGAMVGHMSPTMVRYYTHISCSAMRQAVEMLDQPDEPGPFVDVFVDVGKTGAKSASKMLN